MVINAPFLTSLEIRGRVKKFLDYHIKKPDRKVLPMSFFYMVPLNMSTLVPMILQFYSDLLVMQFLKLLKIDEILHFQGVRALVYFQISDQLIIFSIIKSDCSSKEPHQVNRVGEEKISSLIFPVFAVAMMQV
jgi:hypothetical protein